MIAVKQMRGTMRWAKIGLYLYIAQVLQSASRLLSYNRLQDNPGRAPMGVALAPHSIIYAARQSPNPPWPRYRPQVRSPPRTGLGYK